MSVIVSQTLPFSNSDLDLDNPERWAKLFPLIRPSVASVPSTNGLPIIVDRAVAKTKHVRIAAIATTGNFSSRLLSAKGVAAFATEPSRLDKEHISAEDVANALKSHDVDYSTGLVVIRVGRGWKMKMHDESIVDLEVDGELELDHVVALLAITNEDTKASLSKVRELLELFLDGVSTTTTAFDLEKTGANPSVIHAGSSASFESAKMAIEKDLIYALRPHPTNNAVVYSVHYSDINGFARLENYLLAHEISLYLEERKLPSHITSSTILNKAQAARGWSISICPIPTTYLSPQSKPPNVLHTRNPAPSAPTADTPSSEAQEGHDPIKDFNDGPIRTRVIAGCEALIKEEPAITKCDEIVGDGDCGHTLRDGAKQVLSFIPTHPLSLTHLPRTLNLLVSTLSQTMGGTSGAIYCIFLSSLSHHLSATPPPPFPTALARSLDQLLQYTQARLGDRTMLDCLIPFVETLEKTGDANEAFRRAREGLEGTKKMVAKVGRSSYLDEESTRGVPDPGAWGLLILLEGMVG